MVQYFFCYTAHQYLVQSTATVRSYNNNVCLYIRRCLYDGFRGILPSSTSVWIAVITQVLFRFCEKR